MTWHQDLRQDVAYTLRQVARAPGFAAVVVLTLGIGIGANVLLAGVIDRLVLRAPPHIAEEDRVVRLLFHDQGRSARAFGDGSNYPALLDFQREAEVFESVAAYWPTHASLGVGESAQEVRATLVSPEFFVTLGVRPEQGRFFDEDDGFPSEAAAGGPPLAILSHAFWTRQFGADPAAIGRDLHLGKQVYTIVGVTPPAFRGLEPAAPDVWLPMTVAIAHTPAVFLADRGSIWLTIVARVRRGVSLASAESEATRVWRGYNLPPNSTEATRVILAHTAPGRSPDRPPDLDIVLWVGILSGFVLLLACANVANLLVGRAYVRRREIAVRLAMGASPVRLVRQALVDGGTFAMLGTATGLLLVALGSRVLRRLIFGDAPVSSLIDARLLAFTALVAAGSAILVSLGPMWYHWRSDVQEALRSGRASGGGRTIYVRAALLAVQAGMCFVLLTAAGLFADSLRQVTSLDLGMDVDRTYTVRIPGQSDLSRAERERVWAAARERTRAIAGVTGAALTEADPNRSGWAAAPFTFERPQSLLWPDHGNWKAAYTTGVDSGFFHTIGATTLRGRDFTGDDRRGAARVAIINQPLADLLWPGGDALGGCMRLSHAARDCVTVVGVLPGFWRRNILERDNLVAYLPLAQLDRSRGIPTAMYVSISGDPALVLPQVRRSIQGVRSGLPAIRITSMRDVVAPQMRPWRLAASMFGAFALVALAIAAIGIYGVVSFVTQQRTPEVAVRLALGARTRDVLLTVLGHGIAAVMGGIAFGLIVAIPARALIAPLLFRTAPDNAVVLIGVPLMLLAVAAGAAALPTWRAARTNPADVLRVD